MADELFLEQSNFNAVCGPPEQAAAYLDSALRSKETTPDDIANDFYMAFEHLLQHGTSVLPIAGPLLQSLAQANAPPIISKKLIAATQKLSETYAILRDAPDMQDCWQSIEPEALKVFCEVFSVTVEDHL